jgi:hypothetical protein
MPASNNTETKIQKNGFFAPPKPPTNAYSLFCRDNSVKLKQNPDLLKPNGSFKTHALLKQQGLDWKSVSAEQKEMYKKRHLAEMKAYSRKLALWKKRKETHRGIHKKSQNTSGLKRPSTNFMQFSNEQRKVMLKDPTYRKQGKCDIMGISKAIGRMWAALADEKKKTYNENYRTAMIDYKIAKEKWAKEHPECPSGVKRTLFMAKPTYDFYLRQTIINARKSAEQGKKEETIRLATEQFKATHNVSKKYTELNLYTEAKPSRAETDYFIYSRDARQNLKGTAYQNANGTLNVESISKETGRLWKSMSDTEKTPYRVLHKKALVEHQRAMTQWNREFVDDMDTTE